jgi:hypothetical protein
MVNSNKLLKSLGIAAVLGFAAFMLSGNGLSWVMAAGIFYYEFMVKADSPRGSKKA